MTETSGTWKPGPVKTVVVPVLSEAGTDTVWAGATLARWFDASLHLITNDPAEVQDLRTTSLRLGLADNHVLCFDGEDFADQLTTHVDGHEQAVAVMPASDAGFHLASRFPQPSYMIPQSCTHRLPTGPLILSIQHDESDAEVLSVAAMWARHLECQVRIVAPAAASGDERQRIVAASRRLISMGLDVAVDYVDNVERDITTIAETRRATALLVASTQGDLAISAADGSTETIPVLVCSQPEYAYNLDISVNPGGDESQPRTAVESIERDECLKLIEVDTLGRLGYIDNGWPTVVPVNYRAANGDIFIRSLPGQKLESARDRMVACLEVDRTDKWARTGWSVVVHGPLEVINDPAVLRAAWANDPEPWVTSDQFSWLRLVPLSLTGRRVRSTTT